MGNCNCNPFGIGRNRSKKSLRKIVLLLVGLDNSGKTSAAKSLIGEPVDAVVPTVGFSVISLLHRGFSVMIYDLGGGPQIRDIWHRYFTDVHGVIFVIDASDVSRLGEGKEVLTNLLGNEKVAGKPVLVLANKQDQEGALDELDIVEQFDLDALVNKYKCRTLVETCSTNQGKKQYVDPAIHNGYLWLMKSIIDDYPNLNKRVEADMARQKELDDTERRERRERVTRMRAERGETGQMDTEAAMTGDTAEFPDDPFQPIGQLTAEKVMPLDPSLNTRVILVREGSGRSRDDSRASIHENREASIELKLNRSTSECESTVILVKESPHRINNVRPSSGGSDRVGSPKSVGSGVIMVENSPRRKVEAEKTAPTPTAQDPPPRRDPFLVPAPSPADNLNNRVNVSITEFVKDQLELERVNAQRKKRAPLRRVHKTAPSSLSPEPLGSRENGLGVTSPSRSSRSPSSPLKKATQLPPLKSINHTIEGHWTLPPLAPNPDLSWAIVTADTKVEKATNYDHKDDSENMIKG